MYYMITLFLLSISFSYAHDEDILYKSSFAESTSIEGFPIEGSTIISTQDVPFVFSEALSTHHNSYTQQWMAVTVQENRLVLALSNDKNLSDSSLWKTFAFDLGKGESFQFPVVSAGPEFILIGANLLRDGHFASGRGLLIATQELLQGSQACALSFDLPHMYAPYPVLHQGRLLFVSIPSESQEALIIEDIDTKALKTRTSRITVPLFLEPLGSFACQLSHSSSHGPFLSVEHTIGSSGIKGNKYGQQPAYNHKRMYLLDLDAKKALKIEDGDSFHSS